jgi:hypothetical protein
MQEMVKYLSATHGEFTDFWAIFSFQTWKNFGYRFVSIQVTPLLLEKNQLILWQGSNMQCICVTFVPWLLMAAISGC